MCHDGSAVPGRASHALKVVGRGAHSVTVWQLGGWGNKQPGSSESSHLCPDIWALDLTLPPSGTSSNAQAEPRYACTMSKLPEVEQRRSWRQGVLSPVRLAGGHKRAVWR